MLLRNAAVKEAVETKVSAKSLMKAQDTACVRSLLFPYISTDRGSVLPGVQDSPFATIDDSIWDEKYSDTFGVLDFGVSSLQGPRESMEDCAYIVPRARCGFLFAGMSNTSIHKRSSGARFLR
jgi:hypothetical protein